ncbi:hypothetical protein EV179_001944 [Coemansia sp. RSA 487]|nr:hypothetical protein IW138_004410 [Coemansia sp. RSA 986]KAJ2215720.1 hypothetical protein EV179_001944 [Coemansia sp. RSA 487]
MTKGSGAVFGSVALMEQTPWIMNDTVRENTLFGREYDKEHYRRVVEACALADDIRIWTNGDKTVIGEQGINISGGQRARLALARTVYSKADIYVLDDPLSAVDAHVKRHILDNVIMGSGLLSGKIRVVSVNAKSLLPYFDKVGLITYIELVEMFINNVTALFELPSRLISFNKGINIFRQYMDMDRDDNSVENTVKPPSSWPSAGKIEFRSFSMKYHRDLEYALKNINFTINPGEKIGIRKLIVLDEATADVDLETDREMQKLFRSEFKDCTVLTIAHRLETIMGSDRIIAMDNGTVVEFGPPKELIEKGGYFAELVKASGF